MKRRSFLKSTGLISSTLFTPAFLQSFACKMEASRSGKILIVIQLSGGNDGLNTIVPYRNELYYKYRPLLGLKKNTLLDLNDELALNANLAPLKNLYDEGQLAILNNVGYPNPDRSHFRSMDIWHTASDSNEFLSSGWIGRYLDSNCSGCENNYNSIEVDASLSLALKGNKRSGFALENPDKLKKITNNSFLNKVAQIDHDQENENVAYLYKVLTETQNSADYLYQKTKHSKSHGQYPNTPFGKKLKTMAELVTADTDTKIYYISLSGFDTHAYQIGKHPKLLKQYADGVEALIKDLKSNSLFDDTLIMTFSEFGRRVKQNASKGTDHGTANNLFLMSGSLKKKGLLNEGPDLSNLDKGDLIYKVDFRSVYATILDNWLNTSHAGVLGKQFNKLHFV